MKYKLLFVFALLYSCCFQLKSQEVSIEVPYITGTPEIDGILDEGLEHLKKREFNHIWQFDNPPTDTVPVNYVIGYTPEHFYLFIETQADSINYRNRGFQNGDGFKILFGIPQKDGLTNEFYVLCFSPSKKKNYWARQKIWTYNLEAVLRNFSERTQFEYAVQNGRCGFEALISWNDIKPYHPWMLKEIGLNLYFAKAIGDTITNGYAVVHDYGIWDEQGLLSRPRSNGKFIEVAPYARDKYNCYSSDSSQNDISEAIEDVVSLFSVDTTKIIIGGFSMGGYGALRTFYENPDVYKGIAVFAGHPYLASSWLEGVHPNFLRKEYLIHFSGKPVFIYHGREDGSLPVTLIERMGTELKRYGAKVTLSIADGRGHEYPDKETNEAYFNWLDRITGDL